VARSFKLYPAVRRSRRLSDTSPHSSAISRISNRRSAASAPASMRSRRASPRPRWQDLSSNRSISTISMRRTPCSTAGAARTKSLPQSPI